MIMAQFHLQGIADETALHDRLIQVLELPDNYARTLDSLYSILAERGEQTILWVYPAEDAEPPFSDDIDALLDTLQHAAAENPALSVCVVEHVEE